MQTEMNYTQRLVLLQQTWPCNGTRMRSTVHLRKTSILGQNLHHTQKYYTTSAIVNLQCWLFLLVPMASSSWKQNWRFTKDANTREKKQLMWNRAGHQIDENSMWHRRHSSWVIKSMFAAIPVITWALECQHHGKINIIRHVT